MRKVMFLVVVALVLAGGALKYSDWKDTEQKRAHAVQQMRDPESVQFRNERIAGDGWLCGELNGKNAYGAYSGFKRFASLADDDVWIEDSGYVGAKRGVMGQSDLVIEALDASIKILAERKAQYDKGIEPPDLSDSDRDSLAEKSLFIKRWQDHCT